MLISPYVKATNQLEVNYLAETGHTVLHELGLALESHAYDSVTPEEWKKVVKENTRADADGYFLSCTNTRMIEAVADLERDLGKPVINSNQATIWACLRKLGIAHADKRLGSLFDHSSSLRSRKVSGASDNFGLRYANPTYVECELTRRVG